MRSFRPPAPSCASCRFFHANHTPDAYGTCRIRAPRAANEDGGRAEWPGVVETDYCGEYGLDHERIRLSLAEAV